MKERGRRSDGVKTWTTKADQERQGIEGNLAIFLVQKYRKRAFVPALDIRRVHPLSGQTA